MSAINLRNVKRDFSQLNYRPDVCHPKLIDEIINVLETTGLREEFNDTVPDDLNVRLLIDIVKRVSSLCYANGCDEKTAVVVIAFLVKTYTEYCVDDTVKRTLVKCLKSCPERWQSLLSSAVSQQFISIMENERNQCETEYFLKTLNDCCENFPNFVCICAEKIMKFFELNLRKSYSILIQESSPTQKISAIRCVHESFRFFLAAYRRELFPKTLHISDVLNECFMKLIDSDQLPMETLFNCCLSIVYLNKNSLSALDCWKACLDKQSIRSDLIKLGFCMAVLNTFTTDELTLIEPNSGKLICANIYDIIMKASCRNLNDSSILISSSRVLFVLSKLLYANSDISLEKHQFDDLITFLWLRMDHFLDGVRHLTRDTMMNIIKIKDGHILNKLLERLSKCDTNSKAFTTILIILSDKVDSGLIIKYLPRISEDLIHLMSSNNSAVTIFMNLMLNHFSITESKQWFDYWLCPLFRNADLLEVKHFEQIITKAVKLMPDVLNTIHNLRTENQLSLKVYLICFNVEKKLYIASNINDIENWINQTKFETLKNALHSYDENIRFIAINLILDCHKKTQIFTDKELELIKYFITYNIKNEKASIKQIHLSFVKKMLVRMKESQFSVAVRNNGFLNSTVTKYYTEFQCWFSKFCFHNIFSDATFSRRNFSLESLRLIQLCLPPLGIVGLNKFENVSMLLNCLWDTYEQNKILAKDILTYKHQDSIKLEKAKLDILLKTSRKLASSTSPPDSITAGYLFEVIIFLYKNIDDEDYIMFAVIMELVDELKKEIELAEDNLTLASAKGPMYGLIHCIRHLLNACNWQTPSLRANWTDFIRNISTICLKCIELVSVVVNDSSPEGIVPMDDLCQNNYQVTSQMVLLCSWRSTKESSLLLSDIVSVIADQESEFSNSLVTQICSCLTLLLSETKHRGAFEQIFVAYLKVCSVMWKSPTLHGIPLKYLEDVLTEIKTGLGKTFCVTRRSAGMPFIIQALICTNHDKRKIVDYTMETLISICEKKNNMEYLEIGVVHAQNVLRALFRCSQLGDLVGPFVSRAIDVSIVLFNSSSWPICNSSTLLLSALVNRVFGVSRSSTELSWKNRMSSREFFQRYPELYDTFLNEFKKFSPMDMRPSLYPTLLILSRLYPSANEATDCVFQLAVYIPYIFKCAQSPVIKTRMLAATSLAPQVTQNKLVDHLCITYSELIDKRLNENTMHGLLLQVFSLIENLPNLEAEDLNRLVTLSENILTNYDRFTGCSFVVQDVFLRCITCLWLQLDDLQYDSIKHIYISTLESVKQLNQYREIGQSKYLESAVLFLFSISLKVQVDFSKILHTIIDSKIHCRTTFEVLTVILSEKPVECCDHLEKFKNLKYWNRQVLMNQLTTNYCLTESICQECSVSDSLNDIKYLVLSFFSPALTVFFEKYVLIDDFISKLSNLRRDSEIAHALSCINGYMCKLKCLKTSLIIKLLQVFENIYYAQRSDYCKSACVDVIVNNYNLIVENTLDVEIFLRLWNLMIHYAEDDSEDVRNRVWLLMNKDTNCSKSFELLFDRFEKHFNVFPSAVLTALIYWSYLDVELPQERPEGQVFDGGDTSEFKEHTVRQALALNTIVRLSNSYPESMNLEINNSLQEFIAEEWTYDLDDKPTIQDLSTVKDFMAYAKHFYTRTFPVSSKIPL